MTGTTISMATAPAASTLLKYLHRHVVLLHFRFKRGADEQSAVFTSFVLSVRDHWFLITAGHVIDEIQKPIDAGYSHRCELIDTFASNAIHRMPVPFDFSMGIAAKAFSDEKYDYGVILLQSFYRRQLEQNGIEGLSEEAWYAEPPQIDSFYVLGTPAETVRVKDNKLSMQPTLLRVQEIPERPPEFLATAAPTFWGRIYELPPGLENIEGMSGGPLFAVRREEDGLLRYWLHGVQSRWYKPDLIAACLTKPFGQLIEEIVKRFIEAEDSDPIAT